MAANLHPFIVHFPIALLTIYALMEYVYIPKLRKHQAWMFAKTLLVCIGVAGAFAALSSGEQIEHKFDGTDYKDVVELHSAVGSASTYVFLVLAIAHIIYWIRYTPSHKALAKIFGIARKISWFLIQTPFVIVLALAGLVLLMLTGALGGVLVYGPDVDPVVRFVYDMFF